MILLVEDNPNDAILTVDALRKGLISNPIEVASNAEDAVRLMRDSSKALPTLVMLDIKLNGHDGLWVLERMRDHAPTRLIPVMVFTTSEQQEDEIRSRGMGASAYVRKPVTSETMQKVLGDLGLYWRITSTPPPEGYF
jgi:two-component system response regulator